MVGKSLTFKTVESALRLPRTELGTHLLRGHSCTSVKVLQGSADSLPENAQICAFFFTVLVPTTALDSYTPYSTPSPTSFLHPLSPVTSGLCWSLDKCNEVLPMQIFLFIFLFSLAQARLELASVAKDILEFLVFLSIPFQCSSAEITGMCHHTQFSEVLGNQTQDFQHARQLL